MKLALFGVALLVWLVWLSFFLQKKMYGPRELRGAADQYAASQVSGLAAIILTALGLIVIGYAVNFFFPNFSINI